MKTVYVLSSHCPYLMLTIIFVLPITKLTNRNEGMKMAKTDIKISRYGEVVLTSNKFNINRWSFGELQMVFFELYKKKWTFGKLQKGF